MTPISGAGFWSVYGGFYVLLLAPPSHIYLLNDTLFSQFASPHAQQKWLCSNSQMFCEVLYSEMMTCLYSDQTARLIAAGRDVWTVEAGGSASDRETPPCPRTTLAGYWRRSSRARHGRSGISLPEQVYVIIIR